MEGNAFMPDRPAPSALEHVAFVAASRRAGKEYYEARTSDLHEAMRRARADGDSLRSLSDASGLSIAQVQRICDLSKDRKLDATFPQEADLGELKYKEEER